jgi:arylsulfatase A-like enzyme
MKTHRFLFPALWLFASAPALASQPYNVLLVLFDGLRADRIHSSEHAQVTPEIRALAGDSLQLREHYVDSNYTTPSHMSLFTGHYVDAHRVYGRKEKLPSHFETIAECAAKGSYRTYYFLDPHDSYLPAETGVWRGFQKKVPRPLHSAADLEALRAELLKPDGGPFFAFVQFKKAAHWIRFKMLEGAGGKPEWQTKRDLPASLKVAMGYPASYKAKGLVGDGLSYYDKSNPNYYFFKYAKKTPEHAKLFSSIYDEKVKEGDKLFGELFRALKRDGYLEKTIVILTSDHGEEFLEHGGYRHDGIYNENMHVPLLIWLPPELRAKRGIQKKEVLGLTQSIDVKNTIAAALGLSCKPSPGIDLLSLAAGKAEAHRYAFSTGSFLNGPDKSAVFNEEWKLLLHKDGKRELFHRKRDPAEKINLAGQSQDRVKELLENLEQHKKDVKRHRYD